MNILITICARGGSKGIPGKNIKLLNGKPLIGYTIDVAKRFAADMGNTTIALSTDSDEIIKVASIVAWNPTISVRIIWPTIPVARLMPSMISYAIQRSRKGICSTMYWIWT